MKKKKETRARYTTPNEKRSLSLSLLSSRRTVSSQDDDDDDDDASSAQVVEVVGKNVRREEGTGGGKGGFLAVPRTGLFLNSRARSTESGEKSGFNLIDTRTSAAAPPSSLSPRVVVPQLDETHVSRSGPRSGRSRSVKSLPPLSSTAIRTVRIHDTHVTHLYRMYGWIHPRHNAQLHHATRLIKGEN